MEIFSCAKWSFYVQRKYNNNNNSDNEHVHQSNNLSMSMIGTSVAQDSSIQNIDAVLKVTFWKLWYLWHRKIKIRSWAGRSENRSVEGDLSKYYLIVILVRVSLYLLFIPRRWKYEECLFIELSNSWKVIFPSKSSRLEWYKLIRGNNSSARGNIGGRCTKKVGLSYVSCVIYIVRPLPITTNMEVKGNWNIGSKMWPSCSHLEFKLLNARTRMFVC